MKRKGLTDEDVARIEASILSEKEAEYLKQQEAERQQQQSQISAFSDEDTPKSQIPNPKSDDLSSEKNVDYTRLRNLLAAVNWKEADEETLAVMLKAAGRELEGWLDTESIEKFPSTDLRTIDRLWIKYSDGHFGFSVQKRIWESVGGKPGQHNYKIYKKFCDRVGWRVEGEWITDVEMAFDHNSQHSQQGHFPKAHWKRTGVVGWLVGWRVGKGRLICLFSLLWRRDL